jgi:ferredoxin--NADP+ reductase
VDGPEFDGHKVDFDLMIRRQAMYVGQERRSYDEYLRTRGCRSPRPRLRQLVAQP